MTNPDSATSPSSVAPCSQLISGCLHCLQQCEDLLNLVSSEVYASVVEGNASIGTHLRHIVDRYQCLLNGLDVAVIDYDARKRDKSIETNIAAAQFACASVQRRLQELADSNVAGSQVVVSESVHHAAEPVSLPSSVERELMSLVSHSTHHLALIAILMCTHGYEVDKDFGKAASTIQFERS